MGKISGLMLPLRPRNKRLVYSDWAFLGRLDDYSVGIKKDGGKITPPD